MYGAILGDMIGSPYEFNRGNKSKDFPLFVAESEFTDDTVMAIAVAEGYYGVPSELKKECYERVSIDIQEVLQSLEEFHN